MKGSGSEICFWFPKTGLRPSRRGRLRSPRNPIASGLPPLQDAVPHPAPFRRGTTKGLSRRLGTTTREETSALPLDPHRPGVARPGDRRQRSGVG